MASAKDIRLRPIESSLARDFMRRHHYSGKVTPNSQLHIGVHLSGRLEGVMQYGPSLDRRKMLGLVTGTGLRQCLELNRMAFTERLPRNSESRALAYSIRMLAKHAPHVKWVVTFADATQCGDGTIYRAAGFLLTGIKQSVSLVRLPSGEVIHEIALKNSPNAPRKELGGRSFFDVSGGKFTLFEYLRVSGGETVPGYQLRYIRFVDPSWSDRLTVEPLPYSAIKKAGAGMYKGERVE